MTGRLGVCAGTTGPGATHLLGGLYEARHDHAPVLAIAGDVPTTLAGIDYLQAADHVQAFRDACVYAASIVSAERRRRRSTRRSPPPMAGAALPCCNIPQDMFSAKTSKPARSVATLRPLPEVIPASNRRTTRTPEHLCRSGPT